MEKAERPTLRNLEGISSVMHYFVHLTVVLASFLQVLVGWFIFVQHICHQRGCAYTFMQFYNAKKSLPSSRVLSFARTTKLFFGKMLLVLPENGRMIALKTGCYTDRAHRIGEDTTISSRGLYRSC